MSVLQFLGWALVGFWGLEIVSYALHRWVFHGVLWKIHRTHHVARHVPFELNDLFSIGFAAISIALLIVGLDDPLRSPAFGVGVGFTIYGLLYFIIHDVLTHHRYFTVRSDNRLVQAIKRAHLRHHHSSERDGQEPFGLFLVPRSATKETNPDRE